MKAIINCQFGNKNTDCLIEIDYLRQVTVNTGLTVCIMEVVTVSHLSVRPSAEWGIHFPLTNFSYLLLKNLGIIKQSINWWGYNITDSLA